jgi:hypothetical protein
MLWTSLFFTTLLSICISCDSIDDRNGRAEFNYNDPHTTPSYLRRNLQDTCMAQLNAENCPGLTANQAPVEGCECYNYCGSEFVGCCAINGAGCSVSCSSLSVGEVLTAGCQLPDTPTSLLSSAPSPPPAPTSAPVEQAGTCLIKKNTELCPGLTANQEPVEGCGCYNYCGSEFAGCCPFDSGCAVSCSSLSAGEVLTAGCEL